MRAAEYLGQIGRLDARINNKLREKQQIMELATKVTPTLSDMPRGEGVSDKVASAVTRLVAIEQEIDRIVNQLVDTRAEVVGLLETLPNDEYLVLHAYYVARLTIEATAETMVKSVRQVYRIKSRAMRRVQAILDEKDKGRG